MNKNGIVGAPSVRTYDYNSVFGTAEYELPKEFMLPKECMSDVLNQKRINACAAFVMAGIAQVKHRKEHGEDEQFSPGVFYALHRTEEANYQGMNPDSALKIWCKYGSVPKRFYNEIYEMPEMREKFKANANFEWILKLAEKYKIEGFIGFLKSNYEDMKRAIYEYQTPLFAVANKGFGSPHAIMLVGWNEDGFIIQNSWGEEWGSEGYGTYPLSVASYAYLIIDEVMEMKFTDVKKEDWFYDAVRECKFNGIMNGISETEFAPEQPITRAQAAQLMVNKQKNDDAINKIMTDRMEGLAEKLEKIVEWAYANGYKD